MHPHIPKQEAAQFLPRQRDAARKSVNKEQFRVARHKLRRRTKAKTAYREGYFYPPTEHSVFFFPNNHLTSWMRLPGIEPPAWKEESQ